MLSPDSYFGYFGLAVSGDVLAVSATNVNASTGRVFVYMRDSGGADNWGLVTTLAPLSAGPLGTPFGRSEGYGGVFTNGRYIAVCSEDENGDTGQYGTIYMYGRDVGGGDQWGLIKRLSTLSAGHNSPYLGYHTFMDGEYLVSSTLNPSGRIIVYHQNEGGEGNWGEIGYIPALTDLYWGMPVLRGSKLLVRTLGSPTKLMLFGTCCDLWCRWCCSFCLYCLVLSLLVSDVYLCQSVWCRCVCTQHKRHRRVSRHCVPRRPLRRADRRYELCNRLPLLPTR